MPIKKLLIALAAAVGSLAATATTAHADTPTCFGKAVTVNMQNGERPTDTWDHPTADVILGTNGPDVSVINGEVQQSLVLWGSDTVCALGGNDAVSGVQGSDIIDLGPGNDIAWLDSGDNIVYGGDGGDQIQTGPGHDEIHGGLGWDYIGDPLHRVEPNTDLLDGGEGTDTCWTFPSDDALQPTDTLVSCEKVVDHEVWDQPTQPQPPAPKPPVVTAKSIHVYGNLPVRRECMSRAEYYSIRRGMTQAEVAGIVGYSGVVISRFESGSSISVTRKYRGCRRSAWITSWALVWFDND